MEACIFNDKIIKLWQNHYGNNFSGRSPLLYKEFKEHCLLFISINPGYDPKQIIGFLQGSEFEKLDESDINTIHDYRYIDKYKSEMIEIQEVAKKRLAFFDKFKEISEYVKLPWEHIDLFYKRQSELKAIKKEYYPGEKLTKCAKDQFKISMDITRALKPMVIIVTSALASRIIQQQEIASIEPNENYGTPTIIIGGDKYPIFFSAMLSGPGTLDNGSYERLKWHIRFIIEKLN